MASTIFDANRGVKRVCRRTRCARLPKSASDLVGKTPEEQFLLLANALVAVTDASTRAALAQDIFGRAGTNLLPLLQKGEEGMAALRQQARDLGIVMSADAAAGGR